MGKYVYKGFDLMEKMIELTNKYKIVFSLSTDELNNIVIKLSDYEVYPNYHEKRIITMSLHNITRDIIIGDLDDMVTKLINNRDNNIEYQVEHDEGVI